MGKSLYKSVVREGLHYFMLFLIKCYQTRLFSVHEFEEDLKKEYKRMKALRKKNSYIRDYQWKLANPEQAVSLVYHL